MKFSKIVLRVVTARADSFAGMAMARAVDDARSAESEREISAECMLMSYAKSGTVSD